MGKELARYPSKSKPGKQYVIYESNDGADVYCDCWQWKKNKTCSHLKDYLMNKGAMRSNPTMKSAVIQKDSPEYVIEHIINA